MWPDTPEALASEQERLGRLAPAFWRPSRVPPTVGGCFVCFRAVVRGMDVAFAAAVLLGDGLDGALEVREVRRPYVPGLLALREGPALEAAVRALPRLPELLLVNASGRDHPRRAGLALHLGAVLGVPTVGVTDRPLAAEGPWPRDERGACAPLHVCGELVGYRLRTRRGTRPLCVHAAWRTDPDVAVEVVLAATGRWRTPEPLRLARERARHARASVG
jgi:deoxyribonuclease V